MKKRILAALLCVAMLSSLATTLAAAVPYTPPAMAYKDFGQENTYVHEVKKGEKAPVPDGFVTETDGYGDPVETYYIRYVTTADKILYDDDFQLLPEYVMNEEGEYYVYPTANSSQAVWDSILRIETSTDSAFVYCGYYVATTFYATTSYYYLLNGTFTRAYYVTADTFKDYHVISSSRTKVYDYVMTAAAPADWAENFATYYTKSGSSYKVVTGSTAPAWAPDTYYERVWRAVDKLYASGDASSLAATSFSIMKSNHVILPEYVKVYARYDNKYFYEAIEVAEGTHKDIWYDLQVRYGVEMSTSMAHMMYNSSFTLDYRKTLDDKPAQIVRSSLCRTYINASQSLNTTNYAAETGKVNGYRAGIINKYGNPGVTNATKINDVYTQEEYYNITHQTYEQSHPATSETDDGSASGWIEEDYGSEQSAADKAASINYGVTTYEYKQLWSVINDNYNPYTDPTPVPEIFSRMTQVQLENTMANNAFFFAIHLPFQTRALPGSLSATGGNYSKTVYTMRYNNNSGLTSGDGFGTYRWHWGNISSSYNPFTREYLLTDYFALADKRTVSSGWIPSIWYTAGQEADETYSVPSIKGVQIRTDDEVAQGFRIFVDVPQTSQEIQEVGCVIAPSEVARRGQLYLGMSSIEYYADDYPEYYGIVGDKWMNLCEDTDTYFGASATPNDADSFMTRAGTASGAGKTATVGGKPSGIYTVTTAKADLGNPYNTNLLKSTYAVTITGLHDDFDDYFSFYTMRPYVQYTDGTVVYGEYQYKSIYYIACWTIQQILTNYNEEHSITGANQYTMDQMPLTPMKDIDGNALLDSDGNAVYTDIATTTSGYSPYYGKGENSIYLDERRLEVFRWFAVRTLNIANSTSYRVDDFDDFSDEMKRFVDDYVMKFDHIFINCIKNCESKVYISEK